MFQSEVKNHLSVIALLLAAAGPAWGQTTQPVSITVNQATRFQTMEGFGTGLASDSAVWNPQYLQVFTQDLGASILRIGLTPDIIPKQVTLGPNIQADALLLNTLGNYPQTGWGQFAAKAVAATNGQMKIIGSVWTPPPWMKTNDSQLNGGSLIQTQANLTQFARYMAAYVEGFQQSYGVPLYGISIQNELRFAEPYPSCVYSDSQYVAAVNAVGAEFAKDGITTKIFGPEDVGVDGGWITQQAMGFVNALTADPTASRYIGFWAIHGYSGNSTAAASDANWAAYASQLPNDGKRDWMTEWSSENPAWIHFNAAGQPDGAIAVALNMHESITYGNISAYVYFQMDDGDHTTATNTTLTGNLDTTSLKYNAAKHYMKFIRPGAVRIAASPDSPTGISIDAYIEPDNSMTIELINVAAYDTPTTISIPGTTYTSFTEYLTTGTQPWTVIPGIAVSNGSLSFTVPADSIVTLQSGAAPATAVPEPTSLALVLPAILCLIRRRPRSTNELDS